MAAKEEGEVEEVGLSSWPMSSSYPVTRAQLEARKIVKYITSQKKESEVVLHSETLQEEEAQEPKKGIKERLLGLSSLFLTAQPEEEHPDVDEVDGLAEDILRPLVKLVFLKILLVDIGISFGDVLTDVLQGLSLVFDGDWNVQWSTYHYGVGVLSIMWLPGAVVLLHQATGEATYRIFPENRHWAVSCGLGLIFFLLFPLVPTVLYLRILLMKRRFRTAHEKLVFLKAEASSHEIKAIAGSLESPMELILLLWLVLRGILQLPWDRPLTSSCVGDSLGRVACLPSLPIASIIFSLLSILKTLCDLNISPLVSRTHHSNSIPKLGFSCQLTAQFCPLFVSNLLFRTTAVSFIITFLDCWAIIPGIIVLVLCLAHSTLTFNSQSMEEEDLTGPFEENETNQYDTRSSCSVDDKNSPKRSTPILLNSLLGVLLPMAYSTPISDSSYTKVNLELEVTDLAKRQATILRSQTLLVNTCTITVVIAVFCLVTFTTSFNYWGNILTPWWFSAAFMYLLLLYLLCLLFSWVPDLSMFNKNAPDNLPVTRQRHPTGESSCHSVHSTGSKLMQEDQGPTDLGLKVSMSLIFTCLAVAPSIAGIVLFKTLKDDDFHLMQINERDDGLIQRHFTHLISLNPDWNGVLPESSSIVGCENLEEIDSSLLLMNMSTAACRTLHRRMTASTFLAHLPRSIIILEDLPKTRWRLSSPPPLFHLGQHLPVFRALLPDWSPGWTSSQAVIVRGQEDEIESWTGLSCSKTREIHVGEESQDEGCTRRKRLYEDGRIIEKICVKTSCTKNGMPCQPTAVKGLQVECHSKLMTPVLITIQKEPLAAVMFSLKTSEESNICCNGTKDYIRLFGHECNASFLHNTYYSKCSFSKRFALYPCSEVKQQEHSQFCKFVGLNCVGMKSYLSFCGKKKPIECNQEDLSCSLVEKIN